MDNQLPPPDHAAPTTPQQVPEYVRSVSRYQWRPDVADHRDRMFAAPVSYTKLPQFVNILGIRNKIEDQGPIGSCTGNSATSALEISIGTRRPFSRLMAYYNAREYHGTVDQDSGASIRAVMKGLCDVGVAYEETWPYRVSQFTARPPENAYQEAKALVDRMWGFEYIRCPTLTDIKLALAMGYPVTFGFSTPEIFLSPYFNNFLRLPSPTDRIDGGHAVVAVGYEDRVSEPYLWIRNSWGKFWGIRGYFKMTQNWFTSPYGLAGDAWVIRRKGEIKPVTA